MKALKKPVKVAKVKKLRGHSNSAPFEPAIVSVPIETISAVQEPVEKVKHITEEPTILRLSKKFSKIGGAILGGYVGSQLGFMGSGIKEGEKYGLLAGEYAAKKLMEYAPILGSFKKGGRVKKTGAYILHKGEKVVPTKK